MKLAINISTVGQRSEYSISIEDAMPVADSLDAFIDEWDTAVQSMKQPPVATPPDNGAHGFTEGAEYISKIVLAATEQPNAEIETLKAALAAANEKVEHQYKRIGSLRETIQAQDEVIAELTAKQRVDTLADIALATPPAPEPEPAKPADKPARKASPLVSMSSLTKPEKRRLGWDEFDQLVRSEMKRLAPTPGVMVSARLWDDMRHQDLPTMQAVCLRYDCGGTTQLAAKLGMAPPLGNRKASDEAEGATVAG